MAVDVSFFEGFKRRGKFLFWQGRSNYCQEWEGLLFDSIKDMVSG
jgi:hypothetical protein